MIRRFHSRLSVLFIAFVVMVSGRAAPPTSTLPSLLNHQGRTAVQGANDNGSGQFKFALIHDIDASSLIRGCAVGLVCGGAGRNDFLCRHRVAGGSLSGS